MICHGKNGLENTHREQCFVAGAVMVEGFYFSPVCRQHHSGVCVCREIEGYAEEKNIFSQMNNNLIPNSAFFKHLTDSCWFQWNYIYIYTKISGNLLVKIEVYEKQTRL